MKSYERIDRLEKLGVFVWKIEANVPETEFKRWFFDKIFDFEDVAVEYATQEQRSIHIKGYTGLPEYYLNIPIKSDLRELYLSILEAENYDTSGLKDKVIKCEGHFIRKPEMLFYFRLPHRGYFYWKDCRKFVKR
jgi:hypothetical protein